ncbi:lytic transglycosylase domain-containing protein [Dyella sp. KRB-257]|uniref:lytic transglycosylase domain-containing protein n=1 Tax=Dyella sp. KRB-257 TaxID=3400915 RepID=UPI003C00D391
MRHRGSAGRLARRFPRSTIPLRIAAGCAVVLLLLMPHGAHADAMYRCTGASGEAVFTSKAADYRHCRRIGAYPAPRRVVRGPRPVPVGRDAFAGVAASVETTATALAAMPPPRRLFVGVQSSVQTTAQALPDERSPRSGVAARWNYRESRATPAAGDAPAAGTGDRVLRGAVYRVRRADGSVEYTNIAPARGRGHAVTMLFTYIATCMACDLHSPIHWNSVRLNLHDYAGAIHQASRDYGVNEAFLRAIIHAESAFNPHAMSIKGAQGLMQLMPGTASDMGVLDAFDAEQNIRGGARYLGLLLQSFDGNEKLAAAAYNAGPGAVQRYKGVPPYAETRVYVSRVAALRQRYGQALRAPLAAVHAGLASAIQ